MVESHNRTQWAHTSHLMALIANIVRKEGKPSFSPKDFDPFAKKQAAYATKKDMADLKQLLGKGIRS